VDQESQDKAAPQAQALVQKLTGKKLTLIETIDTYTYWIIRKQRRLRDRVFAIQ
jgi:hypothetical protein